MKALQLLCLIFCFCSCTKSETQHRTTGQPDTDSYYPAHARVKEVDFRCEERPVLLTMPEMSWGSNFSLTYGFTHSNEYWSYDVPDSLKSPGQELELMFKPIIYTKWITCGSSFRPNQIEFDFIKPIWDLGILEVLEINSDCGERILAKVNPYYVGPYYYDRAWVVNLPDSLKIVGKKMDCYSRVASVYEAKKCNYHMPIRQIVVRNILPL